MPQRIEREAQNIDRTLLGLVWELGVEGFEEEWRGKGMEKEG